MSYFEVQLQNITTLLGRESNTNPSTHATKYLHESYRSYLIHVALLAHHVPHCVRKSYQISLTPDKRVIAYVVLTEQYNMSCIYMQISYIIRSYLTPGKHVTLMSWAVQLTPEKHAIMANAALPYFDWSAPMSSLELSGAELSNVCVVLWQQSLFHHSYRMKK